MDIDPDITKWVMEFILKEPNNYHTLNMWLLPLPLPLPNNNLDFLKYLLLKKLEFEISHNPVYESTLELMEQLEEIEFHRGIETVSNSMKRAYCAVIVECTVNHLPDENYMDNTSKYKFFQSVKKVWRGKAGRTERVLGKRGLSSEELCVWKEEMEAAVWDDSVYENVVKKSKAVNAVEAVNGYLREEWEKMGPSFLELVAEKVKDDKTLQRVLGVGIDNQVSAEEAGDGDVLGAKKNDKVAAEEAKNDNGKEVHKEKIEHLNKLVGVKRSRVQPSRNSRGAKISYSDEMPAEPSHKKYKLSNIEEIKKVREALESSAMELQAVVTDPLPGALRMAEEISGMTSKSNKDHVPDEEYQDETTFVIDGAGRVQVTQREYIVSNMRKRSLMERSSSAHTCELDEPTDVSPAEELTNTRDRVQLSRPRIINVSPSSKDGVKNFKARRKNRRWNTEEEDTLRAGVKKYGVGNWKVVLTAYPNTFVDRTEVDLKDKWRNMTRWGLGEQLKDCDVKD